VATFKIGINMAGAISAGAYTAGVLDFLTQALDEWYQAKARGELVPSHDVSIEVISGASAGGMCAAISAVMLHQEFEHIQDTNRQGTTNRFYESWVNQIDIRELLRTDDLKTAPPVVSLLDSTIIEKIADYTLTPGVPLSPPRPYVSPNLTLFLSLTNLRGTPYSLNGAAPGSIEETTFFFGDRIRFQTVSPGQNEPAADYTHTLDFTQLGPDGGWGTLKTAAMATGAFPIFLAPRILDRKLSEYTPPLWESVVAAATGTPPPISPDFPPGTPDPLQTLNVDGGVTNNDPFNYAHDYLARQAPEVLGKIPTSAPAADRAVIGIAPFPTTEKFNVKYQPRSCSGIFSVLGRLAGALISQSRFFGESLDQVMTGTSFDRFVIAPSDQALAARYRGPAAQDQPPALQCAVLGAFGGFFCRGFRAHDYALGRRNCQKFLSDAFVLPTDNVVMKAALDQLDPAVTEKIIAQFQRPAPGSYAYRAAALEKMGLSLPAAQATKTGIWLPIIPLCSPAVQQSLPRVERATMSSSDIQTVLNLVMGRLKAVMSPLLATIPSPILRGFLQVGQPFIRLFARKPLRDTLIKQLGDSYRP
jgi:predicted acylesterase/phospholipase RssA